MHAKSSVLIISYVFPPASGIGGRRWAKFAKELNKRGHKVYIISAQPFDNQDSPWSKDVDETQIKVYRLPAKYPPVFYNTPRNLSDKIRFRLYRTYFKLAAQGNYYDRSCLWKKAAARKVEELIIEHGIKNVIVSGSPFQHIEKIISLKDKYPSVNFISDFRDPWTNAGFFGYSNLNAKRLAYELNIEKKVLEKSDHVVCVADKMTNDYIKLSNTNAGKFVTIPNGFDRDDLTINHSEKPLDRTQINFLFSGTLYSGLNYIFEPLVAALSALKQEQPDKFKLLHFSFAGKFPDEYKKLVRAYDLTNSIHILGELGLTEVHHLIAQADVCMLFLLKDLEFSLSTKFCEYLAQKKPIWVMSGKGATYDFIVSHKLGYAAEPDQISLILKKIIDDHQANNLTFNPHFDIEPFSLTSLTDKLESLLIRQP